MTLFKRPLNTLDTLEKHDLAWYLSAYDLVQNHYSSS
jgi:hypothetical protein